MEQITKALAASLLPARDPDGHKGTFGKVTVIGGSEGYTGAPVFAAEAAGRCGSGLVFLGTPGEVYPIVAARCDSAMAFPLPEREMLLRRIEKNDAVLIGPGLGSSLKWRGLALWLLEKLACPVVLDADGINAAAEHIDSLNRTAAPVVLTPHEGEFLRLGGDLLRGRERGAVMLAEKLNCTVVLKGPGTVVAAPDGRVRINTTGSCALAKGGSGDVLAGMILSWIGQGISPFDAASLAVWIHGRAGDRRACRLSEYSVLPSDLVGEIPCCIKELLE